MCLFNRSSTMGIVVETTAKGNGTMFPQKGDTLTVNYVGKLKSDGSIFDDTKVKSKPLKYKVGTGIKGFDEGVMKMSCGESAILNISADFAYGERGAGDNIPPNADLIFEIELLAVNGIQKNGGKEDAPAGKWELSKVTQVVMIPLMIGFQKLEITGASPFMLYLRVAYGIVLFFHLSILALIYTRVTTTDDETEIYTQPLEDKKSLMGSKDNTKPFEKTTYRKVETALINQTLYQEIFGAVISMFLHFYLEFTAIPLMQCLMLPTNLWDNLLFKIHVRGMVGGSGVPRKKARAFKERYPGEDLTTVADLNKKTEEMRECRAAMTRAMEACWEAKKEDEGVQEMHEDMIECIEDVGINYKLKEDGRTVVMQIAGTTTLKPGKADTMMGVLLKMTKPTAPKLFIKDRDGWTAIHWAAFHGNAGTLSQLLKHDTEMCSVICKWKDSEGFTPLGLATDQNNSDCVKVLEAFRDAKKDN